MEQRFRIAFKYDDKVHYSDRKVRDESYIMAKLTSHSYFGNALMDSVAIVLYNNKTKLAWVGNCAEIDEINKITKGEVWYFDCWGGFDDDGKELESTVTYVFDKVKFDYSKKFLVNLTKNEYISFDEYRFKATDDKQLNPISILTAIGNGQNIGDFYSEDENVMNKVGSWAWDIITIEDEEPKNMTKLDINFYCNEDENRYL